MPISKEVMMTKILMARIKLLKPKLNINLHSKIVTQNQGLFK